MAWERQLQLPSCFVSLKRCIKTREELVKKSSELFGKWGEGKIGKKIEVVYIKGFWGCI